MHIKNTLILAFVGFVSGLVSHFSPEDFLPDFWFKPGTIFGIAIALYFLIFQRRQFSLFKSILWIIASTGSFAAAFYATVLFPYIRNENLEDFISKISPDIVIPLMVGGLVGGCLMAVSFGFFLKSLTRKNIVLLTLLGCILALSWYIIPDGFIFGYRDSWGPSEEKSLGLLVFWQMGMAGALGWVMDKRK